MTTLVMKKNKDRDGRKEGNYLLIAGGFDSEGRAMKNW